MTLRSDVLAYIPSPAQGVWNLGPFPLRAYALCIILGIIVAIWWGERRWQERGGNQGTVLDVARRSEERRVGKECGYQCRSRWSPYH